MKRNTLFIVLAVLTAVAGAKADYRNFTDSQGRNIQAKIISYSEAKKTVLVERKGKRGSIEVPLTIFSDKDQKYIVGWNQNQTFLSDRFFSVDVKRSREKNTELSGDLGSMARKYYDCGFCISLNNKSKTALNDISVEYVLFYTQEHHIKRRTDKEERNGTLYSETMASIPSRSTKEIITKTVCLETYRESGYEDAWPDLRSEVDGIIIKLSMKTETGEVLTRNISYPDGQKNTWTTETQNVQPRI